MNTPYKKIELDETDKAILEASKEVLKNGDKLYGTLPDDLSHIEWAVGLALHELHEVLDNKQSIATLIEIGVDQAGYFISFLPAC
jgi:hypothetical protein